MIAEYDSKDFALGATYLLFKHLHVQVEKVLVQFPELGSNYLITLETVNNQDEMIVEVELSDLSTRCV